MNRLQIMGIIDRGVPQKERLHISALTDANLVYYAVLDSTYGPNRATINTGWKSAYWFNDYPVKAGDWIILYTGSGPFSAEKRADGGTNHFFHWGMSKTLWQLPESCAVLFEINTWAASQ